MLDTPEAFGFYPVILVDLNTPWEKVLDSGTPVSFPVKSVISPNSSGASASGMYYIRRGRVRLSNIAANGQEKVMLYMGRGTLFNEIPMLQMGTDYLFTCMEQTDTVFISKKKMTRDFIREYPELMLNLLDSMSKKSHGFYSQLSGLRAFDSFVNVCRTLYSMHLFNRVGAVVVPRLTQQELAAFLGVHRSSLHKALFRLKDEDIIGPYNRNRLDILDPDRLLAYAHGAEG